MDANNVIQLTNDLNKLDQDMYRWSLLPYDMKMRSDECCLKTYGLRNRELYNRLKANILNSDNINDKENNEILVGNNISESLFTDNFDRTDLLYRISIAKQLNQDPLTAIIYPYLESDNNDTLEIYNKEVNELYRKFLLFNNKYQKISNCYSLDLFGYNVYNMYIIVSGQLSTNSEEVKDDTTVIMSESVNSNISCVKESLDEYLLKKDILNLYKFRLDFANNNIRSNREDYLEYSKLDNIIDECINNYHFEDSINSIVPYYSFYENKAFNVPILNNSYKYTVKSVLSSFCDSILSGDNHKSSLYEGTLLNLGWNPIITDINCDTVNKVRNIQVNKLNESHCDIIDLSYLYNSNNIKFINESSESMRKLYKDKNMYPVYIVLSFSDTMFGNIITKVKKCKYSHAGISLDSNLNEILTFKFDKGINNGFTIENLDKYIEKSDKAIISILCLFVDKDTKYKLEESIKYFISVKDKTKYNFGNLLNILRNKEKDNDPENLSLVCSQFVDTLLKLSGIDITGKSSNLVIPQDFQNIKNPKLFKLYEGLCKDYIESNVENIITTLFNTKSKKDILYKELIEELNESYLSLFEYDYNITDNNYANNILSELYNYLTPINSITHMPGIRNP